jgi:hypothetical protein
VGGDKENVVGGEWFCQPCSSLSDMDTPTGERSLVW